MELTRLDVLKVSFCARHFSTTSHTLSYKIPALGVVNGLIVLVRGSTAESPGSQTMVAISTPAQRALSLISNESQECVGVTVAVTSPIMLSSYYPPKQGSAGQKVMLIRPADGTMCPHTHVVQCCVVFVLIDFCEEKVEEGEEKRIPDTGK